jgi:hypothetical protein
MRHRVQRYNFAIYDGLLRKLCKRLRENWKSICQVILVPRHQPHAATALDSQRPVAIEFDFVFPIRTLRQLRYRKALHRFDESNHLFCTAL